MKNNIILTQEQRENFERFMELSDKYKNSWFWGDNGNASRRHYIEDRDYLSYETVVNDIPYSVYFSVSMSRKNVYVTKQVFKGDKQTTARVIRTLLKKDLSKVEDMKEVC